MCRNGLEYVRNWHDPDKALLPFVRAFEEVRQRKNASIGLRSSSLRELYEPLRHLVPWTIQRCQVDRTKRIAIYGAGNHTRLLLPIWQSLGGPRIRCIVVTGQQEETLFMGYPVVSADRFDPEDVDGIVLSSHGYEEQMAQTCSVRWPEIRIYPIWRPVLEPEYTDLTEGFEALCQQTIPASLYNFL